MTEVYKIEPDNSPINELATDNDGDYKGWQDEELEPINLVEIIVKNEGEVDGK